MDFITISNVGGGWGAEKGTCGWVSPSYPYPNDMSRLKKAMSTRTIIIPNLSLTKYFANRDIHLWGLRPDKTHNAPGLFCPAASEDPSLISESYEEDVRYGSWQEFAAARKSGVVLLRPRRAIRMSMDDQLIPNASCTRVDRAFPFVGFNDYEQAQRRCVPDWYNWSWLRSDGIIPGWDGPVWFASGTNLDMVNAGRYHGQSTVEHWRGTPDTLFNKHGRPSFASVVQYLDNATPPVNLKAEALDENFSGVMDLLTEVAEAPETIKYLFDCLKRILSLYIDTRRKVKMATKAHKARSSNKRGKGRVSNKEFIDEVASLWMQFRYAATPIGYSIEDALKLLNSKPLAYVTTRKREDTPFTETISGITYKGTIEHRYFVKSRLRLTSASLTRASFVKTLYELTPLSFVVDWVFPLGQLLGSLDTPRSAEQVAVLYSKRVRSLELVGIGYASCDYYVAQTTNEIPDGIGFDVNLSFKRVVDSAALSWSLFIKQHWKS